MALPWIYKKKVPVNGIERIDGGIQPLAIQQIIEKFQPTDVLILPNMPFNNIETFRHPLINEKLVLGFAKLLPDSVTKKFLIQKKELREAFRFIKDQADINISILWPPDTDLVMVSDDSDKIKAAVLDAAQQTCKTFGEPEKARGIKLL